ncbi:hypothetical protein [Hahella ganghwensis]|uniref:hypothetical protein n=1 Tax=Hahella ganghwensis TaxID=286420 RepID=UPI0003668586|nr:hypothetical protein [Hahella ganghwensis]
MASAAEKLSKQFGPFTCLALVKPRSSIAIVWKLEKPSYCIFEYSPAFSEVQIRWGDGAFQNLEDESELDDLILLHEFSDEQISELFD